ncbi:MAG: RNA polymerase sigma-70 factor [Bacteroidales bacterium]|nr:RNA polymerase sigma-70 factor [Bacteroidales bacterium]
MKFSEKQIIEKIKAGDDKAFEELFIQFFPALCAYAKNTLKSHYMAEEIVKDTLIKIWEKRESINFSNSLKYYLFKSVLNSCLNYIRHQNIHKEYESNFKYTEEPVYEENDYKTELIGQLLIWVEELPEQCKKVFKMSRFEGYTYEEVATKLKISVKTVEAHIGKALKYLREKKKNIKYFIVLFHALIRVFT